MALVERTILSHQIVLAVATCPAFLVEGHVVYAQQPKRVAMLLTTILPEEMEAFRAGMKEAGHTKGRDIVLEEYLAKGDYRRVRELAAQVVRSNPSVIVADSTPAIHAAKDATSSRPIIMAVMRVPRFAPYTRSWRSTFQRVV
jgi:ABC-type uncharacterized transport system substrate-binding protein